MADYLLDTNHASHLMSGNQQLVQRIAAAGTAGATFGISMTVIGELYFAVFASRKQALNLARLNQLVAQLIVYPFDVEAAEVFGRIQAEQKEKGRPIPAMDAQIAATVRQQNLILLSYDKHFSYVDDLNVENWLI